MNSNYIMQRNIIEDLPIAVKGDGVYIIDSNGKKYLDGSSGAAVSCLGHSDLSVRNAIKEQLDKLAYAHTSFMTSQPAEELAEMLIEKAPTNFEKVYFLSGGSEAVETALKLVRQFYLEKNEPQRKNIIARSQSYHGNTLTTLSVGGNVKRKAPFLPYLSACMHHINPVYAYRLKNENETLDEYGIRSANFLEEKILELGKDTVSAFVVEPLVGSTLGAVGAPKTYFKRIREICDKYDVLLVFDEIMCGTGRTGYMFASEFTGVNPDIITIAKGIGGGYQPLAATLISGKIFKAIKEGSGQFSHGHTYIGHPLACAAGVAVLKAFKDKNLLENVQKMGKLLKETLKVRFKNHKYIGDIRGKGLFLGIELVKNKKTKECFDPKLQLYAQIKISAKEHGLLCYPMGGTNLGKEGDHVLLAPPFIINEEQVKELVDKLETAINQSLELKGISLNTGIMVAPNGARLLIDEHEELPLKKEHIVRTAMNCENAGAQAIHLHVRDDEFKHVLDVRRYKETITAIRKVCTQDFVIQATTEAVGRYKPEEMIRLIKELKPQATSVAIKELLPSLDNIKELKAAKDFYKFSRNENIGVQHILYSSDDLRRFHKLLEQEIITGDKHSILFVLGRYAKDQKCEANDLIPYLQTLKELELEHKAHWMLCAFGQMEIPSLVAGAVLGGHSRVGFENSRVLPTGIKSKNNESQVQYLKQQFHALNIGQVKTNEMREILGVFK